MSIFQRTEQDQTYTAQAHSESTRKEHPKMSTSLREALPRPGEAAHIQAPIEESIKLVAPAWPLQSTVAVNPFWHQREEHICDVFGSLEEVLHQSMFLPLQLYQARYASGDITKEALKRALELARERWDTLPSNVEDFEAEGPTDTESITERKSFAESFDNAVDLHEVVITDLSKYAAAYLDHHQATAPFPWQDRSFWRGWLEGQQLDRAMEVCGVRGFRETVAAFHEHTPKEAIQSILATMDLTDPGAQLAYMRRLLATNMGWASQFQYLAWQRSLGYEIPQEAATEDFLAVRMLYDFACLQYARKLGETQQVDAWLTQLREAQESAEQLRRNLQHQHVWQLAYEITYQDKLAGALKQPTPEAEPGRVQMAFCIDVRSEMLRRHLEDQDPALQTIGFAGFFGVPLDYKRLDERHHGHRLPVLLQPALRVEETCKTPSHQHQHAQKRDLTLMLSFFKNLRKAPLSSFLYVELFGLLSLWGFFRKTWALLMRSVRKDRLPSQFDASTSGPVLEAVQDAHTHQPLATEDRIEKVAGVLQHMGLRTGFGDLIFLVGHGAHTTNNAFASALHCGACGGHAGDANARLLADMLNQDPIREGLRGRGIDIPSSTWFVAGLHETVTDEIHLLDEDKIPARYHDEIKTLKQHFARASATTRKERQRARSEVIDPHAHRRAHNWSEIRPEWGLAGNACFVVAPRHRTKHINLSSRAFLHDYDWRKDPEFATLELIMTAPMVVTNWINMQYYSSVVAPTIFGAGNKVLHNITNEIGVVEGNGGDLRIGLPLQSVHDGERFVHEPLRLSVYLEAPKDQIEKIIETHQVVRDLVQHEWLHILHIDPETQQLSRRSAQGSYHPA